MSELRGSDAAFPSGAPLRVVLCTCDSLFGAQVLACLLACDRLRVIGIVRSSRVLNPRFGFFRGAVEQIRHSGLSYSAYLFCATSVSDAVCRIARRPCVSRLVATHAIPSLTTRNVNNVAARDFIAQAMPQLLVSAFFNQRLSEAVRAIPSLDCVNIHPSLLPEFRGVDPVFFARLRGTERLGVTVHRIAAEFDAGNILAREEVALPGEASVFSTTAALFRRGAQLLIEQLDRIERREAGASQSGVASYDSWPSPAQVRRFRSQGGKLFRAADLVRGLDEPPASPLTPDSIS